MERHKEDSGKAQAEVDRLLEILREMENEKNDKDKKISELERWVKTYMLRMCSANVHELDRVTEMQISTDHGGVSSPLTQSNFI